ncbi:BofC C-terminal domain-containing protein [Paenibacillus sp. TAB 01]|uniref:BofC C-terminal domain-containing protein n=1 Tax=Paenibacillus sp. TAB 01 TaxID=3368988 RepID=UPI003750F6A4
MILLNLLNKIKKKLRWKRRWITLASILAAAGLTMLALAMLNKGTLFPGRGVSEEQPVFGRGISQVVQVQPEEEVMSVVNQMKGQREAYAKKAYVCGEELQLLGKMTPQQILQYHKEHPVLTVTMGEAGDIYFTEKIDDLSPQCKNNAYFGLDAGGNLSLFEGVPESKQVIRTFFQLNIQYLESSLPKETVKQLYRGIPVNNLEEYNSVLSTFADFAVEEKLKQLK